MTRGLAEQEVLTLEEQADELTSLLARVRARSQESGASRASFRLAKPPRQLEEKSE